MAILYGMKTTTKTVQLSNGGRYMLAMAVNASTEKNRTDRRVHVALPEEKEQVRKLEGLGLVKVDRTADRCSGYREWWYSATKEGLAAYAAAAA